MDGYQLRAANIQLLLLLIVKDIVGWYDLVYQTVDIIFAYFTSIAVGDLIDKQLAVMLAIHKEGFS